MTPESLFGRMMVPFPKTGTMEGGTYLEEK